MPSFANSAMTLLSNPFENFNGRTAHGTRMILTHIEDANVVTAVIIGVLNGSEAGAGIRFHIQIAEGSLVPARTRRVAILLDDVAGVKVVQADLATWPSACELENIWSHLPLPHCSS